MLYGYKYVNGKPRTYCKCKGVDNKEYIIRADALRTGATKHIEGAGNKSESKDISGMIFGCLTALEPTDKRASNGNIIWHCKCSCGNYIDVAISNLIRGHTRSCGHKHRSKYEDYIANYLKEKEIQYYSEYRFSDCLNSNGNNTLPFDFYLPLYNSIIEYDGPHHTEIITNWGGEEKLKKTQENDCIKNNYCREHNINILRIPCIIKTEDGIRNIIKSFLSPLEITVA